MRMFAPMKRLNAPLVPIRPIARSVVLLSLIGAACGGGVEDLPGAKGDLLAGRSPSSGTRAQHVSRMTDGFVSNDGGFWRTDVTSFMPAGSSVTWDLGEVKPISCAYLQGDNNDTYELEGSDDGRIFSHLWSASPVPNKAGMQPRTAQKVDGRARYVRLTARGGDGSYSIGEVALFSDCSAEWPPRLVPREGSSDDDNVRFKLMVFGIVSALFMLLNRKGGKDWVRLAVVVPLGIGLSTFLDLRAMWPFEETVQTAVRAVVAGLATLLVFREYVWPRLYPVSPKASAAALALLAVVAASSYYHFGWPQFRDESKGRQTLVHPWDMRVYFPVAKYFHELRFDGLYLASVAAHLDNHPGMSPESVAHAHMRDLTNNEMRLAGQVMDQIQAVRQRFTPERWESFKKDMKYFEDVMGPGAYLGSMQDHGGNATPVWLLGAYLLWHNAPANELTLTLTGLIDPLLWILLFVVMARTFGLRVMLIVLTVWGTTDFSRFGTNLMGSTLRADWMVALGLGACALRKRRWALGGGLMAYGGLIRAFPAFASIFLAVPPVWWLIDRRRAAKKLPSLREFGAANQPALRAIGGVVVTVAVLVAASSAVFGFAASWGGWAQKIAIHAEQPNSNHVGIRNVVSYSPSLEGPKVADERRIEPWSTWQDLQRETFARRKPLFYLAVLLYLGLALVACRRLRLEQAAILGLMMIPVFFYPANYYCHYVFLIPLLGVSAAAPRRWTEPEGRTWFGLVASTVLAMGFLQYFTLDSWAGESDVTATGQSVIMLVAYLLLLVPLARSAWAGLPPLDEAPPASGTEPPPAWTGVLATLWRWWQGSSAEGGGSPAKAK
jgi:hypothetical protein